MTGLRPVQIESQSFPVKINRNKRAKRITLRVCPRDRLIKVTLPPRMPLYKADDFIQSHTGWIQARLGRVRTQDLPQEIMFMGENYQIQQDPLRRKSHLCKENKVIFLPPKGSQQALKLVVMEFAKETLSALCMKYAENLGYSVKSISFRDPKSRWGSCSSEGKLMLSWRLVLAPPAIARYVCIHEVCHLQHMNHSGDFWQLVASFDPDYLTHRKWLRKQGHTLYSFRIDVED